MLQLEEELDTKIYPGTEIMSDVGSHHFVKAGEGSGNVLVPQPSNDPHDPLVGLAQTKVAMQTLTLAELESILEDLSDILVNSRLLRPRLRTASISAYVSTTHGSFRCESCGRRPIHWCMYPCARLQQLHLVRSILSRTSHILTEVGYQFKQLSGGDRSSYSLPSSASQVISGELLQKTMQA